MAGPIALTGTPGTGKSAVARHLAGTLRSREVGELANELGCARRVRGVWQVDLSRLRRVLQGRRPWGGVDLVVGHLAHLLPIRDVLVLRCHPEELLRRLRRARRGSPLDRSENYVAEATDVVLWEAVGPGRRVWEIDTTGRSVERVAALVARRWRTRGRPTYGGIDWLADPRVTAHLLRLDP
jgi:adenylate kinase